MSFTEEGALPYSEDSSWRQHFHRVTCLFNDCEATTMVYVPDEELYEGDGWHEQVPGAFYCPDHPLVERKPWIYEGSAVAVEREGEMAYGEIVSFTENRVIVKFPTNGSVSWLADHQNLFDLPIETVMPA